MSSTQRFFITGTDTGIGKTYTTCALLRALQRQGKTEMGIKPILTGEEVNGNGWEKSDTVALMENSSVKLPIATITPFIFALPTTPHIASTKAKRPPLTVREVMQACDSALVYDVDVILIEGMGGWQVELNQNESMSDLAAAFNCPIILVIGMRLGCMNHALLTVESILAKGLSLHGWIANQIDPEFAYTEEYLETFRCRIPAPMLGYLPYQATSFTLSQVL